MILFREDGSYERYKAFESKNKYFSGVWFYTPYPNEEYPECNNLLLITNDHAVLDGVDTPTDEPQITPYEIIDFQNDVMVYRNLQTGNITVYQRLG